MQSRNLTTLTRLRPLIASTMLTMVTLTGCTPEPSPVNDATAKAVGNSLLLNPQTAADFTPNEVLAAYAIFSPEQLVQQSLRQLRLRQMDQAPSFRELWALHNLMVQLGANMGLKHHKAFDLLEYDSFKTMLLDPASESAIAITSKESYVYRFEQTVRAAVVAGQSSWYLDRAEAEQSFGALSEAEYQAITAIAGDLGKRPIRLLAMDLTKVIDKTATESPQLLTITNALAERMNLKPSATGTDTHDPKQVLAAAINWLAAQKDAHVATVAIHSDPAHSSNFFTPFLIGYTTGSNRSSLGYSASGRMGQSPIALSANGAPRASTTANTGTSSRSGSSTNSGARGGGSVGGGSRGGGSSFGGGGARGGGGGGRSDARLKTEIARIEGAEGLLSAMHGYQYSWRDTGDMDCGVLAQEIEKIAPHLVSLDAEGMRVVNYFGIIAVLIEANKSMLARIHALESRL
jgi:hypothetical protein